MPQLPTHTTELGKELYTFPSIDNVDAVLTPSAIDFLLELNDHFESERQQLLKERAERQLEFDQNVLPDFLLETENVRTGDWTITPVPKDLRDRRVEITGPVERKMIINALNSGAKTFMADFEDSNTPNW